MKQTLVFLLVATLGIAAIDSAPQKRDVSAVSTTSLADLMGEYCAAFQHMAPCGDASTGVPIFAPLRFPIVSLDINQELLVLNGSIKNFVLTGLIDFIIIELSTNSTNNRTSFDLMFKDVQLLGEFNLYVNADLAGYKIVLNLLGLMNLQVVDVRVNGGVTVDTNAVGGTLFSDVEYYVQVGDIISHTLETQWMVALNNYVNKYIRDTALVWLELNRQLVNQLISNYITETVNTALYNVTVSEFLQGMVNLNQEWNAVTCPV